MEESKEFTIPPVTPTAIHGLPRYVMWAGWIFMVMGYPLSFPLITLAAGIIALPLTCYSGIKAYIINVDAFDSIASIGLTVCVVAIFIWSINAVF